MTKPKAPSVAPVYTESEKRFVARYFQARKERPPRAAMKLQGDDLLSPDHANPNLAWGVMEEAFGGMNSH